MNRRLALLLPVLAFIGLASALALGEGAQGDLLPTLPDHTDATGYGPDRDGAGAASATRTTRTTRTARTAPPRTAPAVPARPPDLDRPEASPAAATDAAFVGEHKDVTVSAGAERRPRGLGSGRGRQQWRSAVDRQPEPGFERSLIGPADRPATRLTNAFLDPRASGETRDDGQLPARATGDRRARCPWAEPELRHRGQADRSRPPGPEPCPLFRPSPGPSPCARQLHHHDRGRSRYGSPARRHARRRGRAPRAAANEGRAVSASRCLLHIEARHGAHAPCSVAGKRGTSFEATFGRLDAFAPDRCARRRDPTAGVDSSRIGPAWVARRYARDEPRVARARLRRPSRLRDALLQGFLEPVGPFARELAGSRSHAGERCGQRTSAHQRKKKRAGWVVVLLSAGPYGRLEPRETGRPAPSPLDAGRQDNLPRA